MFKLKSKSSLTVLNQLLTTPPPKRWRKILFFVALISVGVFFGHGYWRKIDSQEIDSWKSDRRADCAIVLTGGLGRLREGFDLLAQGRVKKLIVSGVHPKSTLKDIFPMMAFYPELNESDIVLEKRSMTTFGNAVQSLSLVEALHCRDVLLVTSQVHMYRALRTFHAIFPSTIDVIPDAVVTPVRERAFYESSLEVVKTLFYSTWAF